MTSANELLNKIKSNKQLGPAEYTIHYYDRIIKKDSELKVEKIQEITKTFLIIEKQGKGVHLPIHRIDQIKKKGKTIWQK